MTPITSLDVVVPMYNGRRVIGPTLDALMRQQLHPGLSLTIVVVDDASTDDCTDWLAERYAGRIELLRLPHNRGRAGACNAGVQYGRGDAILFLDVDCRPIRDSFLQSYVNYFDQGYDLVLGDLDCEGNDFWSHYQRQVFAYRREQIAQGNFLSMTSANMALSRSLFKRSGGFDERYRHYGFEDRDLLIRLLECKASPIFGSGLVALHNDQLKLISLCRKMDEAGRYSASIFARTHPRHYQSMPYARIDGHQRRWLRIANAFIAPFLPVLIYVNGWLVGYSFLPFQVKAMVVRMQLALSYLKGTCRVS